MRRWLLAGVVVVAILSVPAEGYALTCLAPDWNTPQELIAHDLSPYEGPESAFQLLVVGRVTRIGESQPGPLGSFKVVNVDVVGAFGSSRESSDIEATIHIYEGDGIPIDAVGEGIFLPLRLRDGGYHVDLCVFGWGEVEDPEALVAELTGLAEQYRVPYYLSEGVVGEQQRGQVGARIALAALLVGGVGLAWYFRRSAQTAAAPVE